MTLVVTVVIKVFPLELGSSLRSKHSYGNLKAGLAAIQGIAI